jgi:hypothetical protein
MPLAGGVYVEDEWETYGLTLSANGGFGSLPRLFNTSSVGNDPDLGSPNEKCTPSGPGKGEGGQPGSVGANCQFLGNVLIIQDSNKRIKIPDDNVNGGSILFEFETPVLFESLGLLDMDYASFITILTESDSGEMEELPTIDIELLGDNSFQTMNINVENVKQLRVSMARSGAVTDIAFCYPSTGPTPVAPTKTPTTPVPPTKAPIGDAPPNSVPGGPECIYINAGGSDYLDPDGVTWQADEGTGYFTASDTFTTSDDISNTDKPDIYQSERYASELMYDIDLANGEYNIFLHFAEIFKESFEEGARVMDIFIEGDPVTVNLDVYKAAGNAGNSAYILSIADVIVADGSLTIDFVSVKQNATISAVEICASSPSDGPDAPSASPSESPSKSSTSPNYHRHLRFGHN